MNYRTIIFMILASLTQSALAERADRDKPLQLEANRISIDDAKKIQILEGDVVVIKGTMVLRADRVVVTEDQYGFQKRRRHRRQGWPGAHPAEARGQRRVHRRSGRAHRVQHQYRG